MVSDCRVTFSQGSHETHRDTVQKLVAITPTTAIGFVGDLKIATTLLVRMLKQGGKKRTDPFSLLSWFHRCFRHHYAQLNRSDYVAFMVGSVVPGRPNVIEKEAVVKLVNRVAFGNPSVKRNWLPGLPFQILQVPGPLVLLGDAPLGILYIMDSPDFAPRFFKPLDYVAIGSGEGVVHHIDGIHDMIFAGEMGGGHMEAMWLTTSIHAFLKEKDVSSVGGMFTMLKLTDKGIMHLGHETGAMPNGPFFELAFENDRWVQKNLTTGKEIKLLLPWELNLNETNERVFDDNRFGFF